ncbi:hypothetical protein GALMADRAFT_144187 [Galerina marginata CBS 339.88]|uniref:Uncharacterized protein n=1 Tax=Galerina marginata (strain CBS 339.88) TaxID=685588 RepID=A0A067SM52_GALM3|nr:hypothetical protein GALMADRAFT_144187 [Galerina marginata CBS 339.88]
MSLNSALSHPLPGVFGQLLHLWSFDPALVTFRFDPPANEASWEGLKGGEHCLRYLTREYTAKLVGGAVGQDMMKLCKDTPAEIHGRLLFTDFCQDLGFGRGIWGFWAVDFEEPDCETKWGDFVDLGCAMEIDGGNTYRRIESQLENLQSGSSWQIMCVTTPADINGRHFASPDTCYNSLTSGTYGVWDLTDSSCGGDSEQSG